MPKIVDGTASEDRAAPADETRPVCQLENISLVAKAYVPATDTEIDCIVTSLSPDGANLSTALASSIGSEIALYIAGFDRFSTSVLWTSQDALKVRFNCSRAKRERTAEKIRNLAEGRPIADATLHRAQQTALHSTRHFKRKNGESAKFDVIDIALSGASLRTWYRPAIGEIVTIGSIEGRVTRHFDDGIAVEFTKHTPSKLNSVG